MNAVVAHMPPWRELAHVLGRHRELLWEMTKRDFAERYARHWLGTLWAIAHPLVLMALYLLIFAVIFRSQLTGSALPSKYAVFLLAGLVPWITFQEAMSKSCGAIVNQAALVKQVVFPVSVLPVSQVLASSAGQVISLTALLSYVFISRHALPATVVLLPLLIAVQIVAMIGVGLLFSAVCVYLRDLKELVQVFGAIGVYLLPIFYPIEWAPAWMRALLYANPFTYMVWCYQDALYAGRLEHPMAWLLSPVLSVGLLMLGAASFRRLSRHFGSVL